MNYHRNSYTGSVRRKVLIRSLIVVAALIAVSAATFAYGNYLKAKAGQTLIAGTGAGRDQQSSGAGRDDSDTSSQAVKVKSACVPLALLPDAGKASEYVDALAADGNTGISVVLVDREGYLTYPSEAVAKFTHQRPSSGDLTVMQTALSKAGEHSMRKSGLLFAGKDFADGSFSAEIDALVAADAAAFGFDELVIVLPVETDQLARDFAEKVVGYLNTLAAKASPCQIGVCLSYDIFNTPQLSPHLELISSSSDFLAVDLTKAADSAEAAAKYVTDAAQTIAGYFSMYSLRVLFEGTDAEISSAQVKVLSDKGLENYMLVSAPPVKPADDTDDTGDADGGQDNPDPTPPPSAQPDNNGGTPAVDPPSSPEPDTPDSPSGAPAPDTAAAPPETAVPDDPGMSGGSN